MTKEPSEAQQSYEMVSVRRAAPPPGTEGSNWHRYVIAFGGNNSIRGCRKGDFGVVTGAVKEIVAQLNERHRGKHGRVHLVMTPKRIPTRPSELETLEKYSTITCPKCGNSKRELMPTNACQFFYACEGCGEMLKPKKGDCCVFCSFGDIKCPPVQKDGSCCT